MLDLILFLIILYYKNIFDAKIRCYPCVFKQYPIKSRHFLIILPVYCRSSLKINVETVYATVYGGFIACRCIGLYSMPSGTSYSAMRFGIVSGLLPPFSRNRFLSAISPHADQYRQTRLERQQKAALFRAAAVSLYGFLFVFLYQFVKCRAAYAQFGG
jgi:hypothetical protein